MTDATARPAARGRLHMSSHNWAPAVATAALTFLIVAAFQRAFAAVFVLNFSVEGPGPSLALVGLAISGLAVLVVRGPRPRLQQALPWAAGAAFGVAQVDAPGWAAVGAFAFLLLGVGPWWATLGAQGRGAVAPMVAGVLVHAGGRAALGSAPWDTSAAGQALVWVVLAAWLAAHAVWRPLAPARVPRWGAAGAFAWLFAQFFFLGSVAAVARWGGDDPTAVAAFGAAGLAIGTLGRVRRVAGWAAGGALSSVLLVAGIAPLAALGAAQVCGVRVMAFLLETPAAPPRAVAKRLAAVQGALVALALVQASAANWAFMPPPLDVASHGMASFHLGAMLATLPVLGLLAARTRGAPRDAWPAPAPGPLAVAALAVLAAGPFVGAAAHEPKVDGAPWDGTLRAMTYNVHQFYPTAGSHSNLEAFVDVIAAARPHVVGLQESEGTRVTSSHTDGVRWLAHRLGMHSHAGPPARDQSYGIALLSVWPILDARIVRLPSLESVERIALVATIDAPGAPFEVLVTHFQTDAFPDDRLRQAQAVAAEAASRSRLVVLGDLNTEPGEPPLAVLTRDLADAWAQARPGQDGWTDPASEPARRIDLILAKGWRAVDADVVGGPDASDHRAVVVDLVPLS